MTHDVRDLTMVSEGLRRIAWAEREMPVLRRIRERFTAEQPLRDRRIAACLHVTTETAALILTLRAGGGQVTLCASNPLSTQDDVAAALAAEYGIGVFAIRGEDRDTYYRHIHQALGVKPHVTMDDGADLVSTIHNERTELLSGLIGGTEETTTGVIRLRAMARDGALRYPIIAVNDAKTKHLFDNRYGTGQSTIDGLLRATNILLAGRTMVVCGYGSCGRGLAMRARGMGAVQRELKTLTGAGILTRTAKGKQVYYQANPQCPVFAELKGLIIKTAGMGDIFITVTGNRGVIRREHFEAMRDGAIVANSGHFNVEIDIPALEAMAATRRPAREHVEEFALPDGRRIYLLAEGRLLNLAAAEGHPAAVMDMSFANQALSVAHLAKAGVEMERTVHTVPRAIDEAVAQLKLEAMGVAIDALSEEQRRYLESWQEGT